MYKLIAEQMQRDGWEKSDKRWMKLDCLDKLLDGEFYDHLPYAFTQETMANGTYIPIGQRRPSVRFGLPGMVAKMTARKLFSGRHTPTLVHPKESIRLAVQRLIEEGKLLDHMVQAAVWGSVGSVAMTFRFLPKPDGDTQLVVRVWRAKNCVPYFNNLDELEKLRVQYVISGLELLRSGYDIDNKNAPINPKWNYWFIREFSEKNEATYYPIKQVGWNPGVPDADKAMVPMEVVDHKLGFVPAHWFVNLTGGSFPDGACTWGAAIPNCIEIDYTLSQLGRGIRYNASPELVIKGKLRNITYDKGAPKVIKGGVSMLMFDADRRDSQGNMISGGDAKLLEMSGRGIEVGIQAYISVLRKQALEQIAASRKDPDKITTALSGTGMRALDEEFDDLVAELRTTFGDNGYLIVIKKVAIAASRTKHKLMVSMNERDLDDLAFQWPKTHDIAPADFLAICQGLAAVVEGGIMTKEEAHAYLISQIDYVVLSANRVTLPKAGDLQEPTEVTNAKGPPPKDPNDQDRNSKDMMNNAGEDWPGDL